MKRHQNLLLLVAVVLLTALPLCQVQRPEAGADGKPIEIFTGADDKAMALIGQIAPSYQPWFEPLMEPASGEVASLLFALQAALGAGFIGYYLGVSVTREKMRREAGKRQEADAGDRAC
ncbi:energy-coupling factor ABC transporter substrate-binding protein [Accumulibacter sp.]|uniref:Cobalt transport protein CbiN n=1 Tax=Accumulibacter regalis TaxID=522306 RepID=C7RMY1_ACCRE|nr:energy-coupling factor ABC transporter substrate-binding protein [Accumulibacter sp.]MBN8499029.1 energy-coupling factor ABC transporter substrate-binding protein [Accumulibacter sp.]MBO3715278.1 energy-coupling factor ABC transporter substrate-binding protein [Accumulibacter sp.]